MDDSPSPISETAPATPSDSDFDLPVRGLLDQRIFCFDVIGLEGLIGNHAKVLVDAIAIAHRLVFCPKSLGILNLYIGWVLASTTILPADWQSGYNTIIASALNKLAANDGMSVIVDRETHQDGFVSPGQPKCLRINALLVTQAIEAKRLPTSTYHIHLFHLASVLAHLICRSIRCTLAGPGHEGDWLWDVQFFGGFIERILDPDPYAKGQIISLVVAFEEDYREAHHVLSSGVIQNLIEGEDGWEVHLPLWSSMSRVTLGRHRDQIVFQEVPKEEAKYEVVEIAN